MSVTAEERPALGLYVHVPFCEVKCAYCHFAIDPRRPEAARERRYVEALLREIEARAPAGRVPADTLYFGGGTPSLLGHEGLERLLEALRGGFSLAHGAEITLEANPRDLDASGYAALRGLGIDRLSLGVQSFDDGVLQAMGRRHDAGDARRAVAWARQAGFENLSLDLILGWPGEEAGRWSSGLEALLALEPEHVSLYVLEVEGRTLLEHRHRRGLLALPDDDLVAELYERSVECLEAAGLRRYEISNFARPGRESRHNSKYWDDLPFLGFGQSAHSYDGRSRPWNHETFGAYCRAVESRGGGAAVAGERVLSPRQRREEALFTGLRRRQGVELARFRERYGRDPLEEFGPALTAALEAGLLYLEEGRLALSGRGVLLSNEVFAALLGDEPERDGGYLGAAPPA